jgi:hypothetical protein
MEVLTSFKESDFCTISYVFKAYVDVFWELHVWCATCHIFFNVYISSIALILKLFSSSSVTSELIVLMSFFYLLFKCLITFSSFWFFFFFLKVTLEHVFLCWWKQCVSIELLKTKRQSWMNNYCIFLSEKISASIFLLITELMN